MQNAFHEVDTYCGSDKQYLMMKILLLFHELAKSAVEKGVLTEKISEMPVRIRMARMGIIPDEEYKTQFSEIKDEMENQFRSLE